MENSVQINVNPTHSQIVNGKEIFSTVFHRDSPIWVCSLENRIYSFIIITEINGWNHTYFSRLKIDDYTLPRIEYLDQDTKIIFRLEKHNEKILLYQIEYPNES